MTGAASAQRGPGGGGLHNPVAKGSMMQLGPMLPGIGVMVPASGGGGASGPTTWSLTDKVNANLSNGNLTATTTTVGGARATKSQTTGKLYIEYTYTTISTNSVQVGLSLATGNLSSPAAGTSVIQRTTGGIVVNGSGSGVALGIVANGSVIGIAVDLGAALIWYRVAPAGNWNASGTANPATGTLGVDISSISGALFPLMSGDVGDVITANFGASAFSGAVPAGFSGWGN